MKKFLKMFLILAQISLVATMLAIGKGKPAPVSGTWACVAHGTDQGDINYTYVLAQDGEKVTGSFSDNSDASQKSDIKDGAYKDKKLSLSFDAYNGTVSITGALAKAGAMSGNWTHSGGGQGTWDCTKGAPQPASK